jgi:flagellar biosynthesis protein FlhF
MNVKRFVGKNTREAMAQVRAAYGDEAVLLSNRAVPGGVEILAMPSADVPTHRTGTKVPVPVIAEPETAMSTLSFQEFVRERARKRASEVAAEPSSAQPADLGARPVPKALPALSEADKPIDAVVSRNAPKSAAKPFLPTEPARFAASELAAELQGLALDDGAGTLVDPLEMGGVVWPAAGPQVRPLPSRAAHPDRVKAFTEVADASGSDVQLLAELKSMRGMIASQLSAMSWFDSVRRSPTQTRLLRLLIGNGFSAGLARHFVSNVPSDYSEAQASDWLSGVLCKNLRCSSETESIVDRGGVFAVVGPTGVGKTTTTAKIAAQFAMKHGAASLGLITVDTYRLAASDQLRAFGRILNIPVHTAHDAASLLDMLDLFKGKKLVLIDTVGVGQRDRRLSELFAALPRDRISRLLVLNAAAQAETLEDVVQAYRATPESGVIISKLDEAVKTGPVVDLVIRHRLRVEGIANGQRVPEDWHPARAHLLVQRALIERASPVFAFDDSELSLMLSSAANGAQPLRSSSTGSARA